MEILRPLEKNQAIPKIIHQTLHSKILPPPIEQRVNQMKALNPSWQHKLYDDADIIDFISDNYGTQVLNRFNRINPKYGAARADLFRYLLIYKVGGVYLDIKSATTRALDDVLKSDDSFLLANWKNAANDQHQGWGKHAELKDIPAGEFQQWHIIAAPGHPFLEAVINRVLKNIDRYHPGLHGVGKQGVLRLTGPIPYTRAIAPLLSLHSHRLVDSEKDLGFEYSLFGSDNTSHIPVFKSHYSLLKEPVVTVGFYKKASTPFFKLLRKSKTLFRLCTRHLLSAEIFARNHQK